MTPMEDVREATKRPWSAEPNGKRAAWIGKDGDWAALACGATDAEAVANAALIVRAVNSYDQMREALEKCLTDELRRRKDLKTNSPAAGYTDERVAMIRAALAASELQP